MATKDGVRGTVVQVPYPTRSDAESAMPPVKKDEGKEAEVATTSNLKEEKAKEAARKVWSVASFCYCCRSKIETCDPVILCGTETHSALCLKARPFPSTLPFRTLRTGVMRYRSSSWPSDKQCKGTQDYCEAPSPPPPSPLRIPFLFFHQAAKLEAMQKKLDALKARRGTAS